MLRELGLLVPRVGSSSGMSSMSGGVAALAIMSSNTEGGIVNSGTIIGDVFIDDPTRAMFCVWAEAVFQAE